MNNTIMSKFKTFNPISAGVLENQDMLGGGPPLNPMFDVQI